MPPVVEKLPNGLRVTRDVRNTVPAPYHAQQALMTRCGGTAMQPIAADAALGQFRFVMQQRLDREAQASAV